MEISAQVGETAEKIWHLLNAGGPQTFSQLKKNSTVPANSSVLPWSGQPVKAKWILPRKRKRLKSPSNSASGYRRRRLATQNG
jgi:hypothetical protein